MPAVQNFRYIRDYMPSSRLMQKKKPDNKARPRASRAERKPPPAVPAVRIPGVPPLLAGKLQQLGILCSHDLVLHLPLRYEDETSLTPIAQAHGGGAVQIEALVQSTEVLDRKSTRLTPVTLESRMPSSA